MLSITNLLILLLIGALLWQILKEFFEKNYGTYLIIAFLATVVVFFLVRLPEYTGCIIIVSIWNVLTFPLQPLGLCLVILLVGFLEANRKIEDDPQGKKAQESRKKIKKNLITALLILLISSMPASAEWLGGKIGQTVNVTGRQGIVDYVPSSRGLYATSRVLEKSLPLLYYPFTICPKPSETNISDRN
ncbi:MAG: hypothetical protein N3E45_11330 [Oscillatoriaceae bacterium SKW80]|nr:hypothetical protein [Oscillatoriaceae bacterium SKYG93]MCX8121397.1 hypothetical protein [Oscillatoriaceae bacterium SKW80]MDW8451926.1 hypothetical protein [Oscillatoriaceae cyanobacterium SKYGB_i_bin93]HIK29469.1 hypothetical protein [Oscillatoriaceae cyanobacterium M7585_C2015_266]